MNQEHQKPTAAEDRVLELRARLLSQTTGVIRRRRYYRRTGMFAACVGCYLAGLLTVSLMADGASSETVREVVDHKAIEPSAAVQDDIMTEPLAVTAPVVAVETGSDAEMQDEPQRQQRPSTALRHKPRKKKSRFLSLRDLGDQYLLEQQDPAGAARCYQMALRYSTEDEVNQQSDEGTWLFRALKLDHHWETDDARNQG
ncbi:hypothetical protein CA54_50950 [Symmachiella macrocystis]|uniref:Uncharacterized protein n=1 Tax=Symmachiella macrocystis TaxID=2527985 RepID=A0A5C6B610_9PLAN|nr:hypothetical protein [Symmachiella macrocystis]TWU06696.1 hypothetical protein CA54_50950 [Symmachiella macrocystis]